MKPEATTVPAAAAWFCLRSRPKHEHIAAGHLRQIPELEVFLPRIRFRRETRRGAVWFTEALFPNYLFARFAWQPLLRRVQHAPGVAGVIHFGDRWPTIPEPVMLELRSVFGTEELHVISAEPEVGEAVKIAGGALHGWEGLVTQVLPARQRVTVLLDFLGRQTSVELPLAQIVRGERKPEGIRRL